MSTTLEYRQRFEHAIFAWKSEVLLTVQRAKCIGGYYTMSRKASNGKIFVAGWYKTLASAHDACRRNGRDGIYDAHSKRFLTVSGEQL